MKIGIVGLPNVGKSTLFNALTNSYAADAANFPFCTIEPNVGIVDVKDPRVDALAAMSKCTKIVHATTKFVDIAGLVKGASKGEGLGNKFLAHIREVDAIVQVVRHFSDTNVTHVEGGVDPSRDVSIINTELIIVDLEQIEKKLQQLAPRAKTGDKTVQKEIVILTRCKEHLEQERLIIDIMADMTDEEKTYIKNYQFLTAKPYIYAINISMDDLKHAATIKTQYIELFNKPICIVCAKLEHEMIGLTAEEKQMFLEDALGGALIEKNDLPTLDTLIHTAFDQVGLMYYFTSGEKETRARTIPKNSTAPQAASAIHTDFEKGFIKAEIVSCDDLMATGSRAKAREHGKLRLEGKSYIVKDGDVIVFKFNV